MRRAMFAIAMLGLVVAAATPANAQRSRGGFGGFGGGGAGFDSDFGASMSDIFDDLFGDFMGQGGARRQKTRRSQERGSDLRYNMEISLADAYTGKSAEIKVPSSVQCETCNGKSQC